MSLDLTLRWLMIIGPDAGTMLIWDRRERDGNRIPTHCSEHLPQDWWRKAVATESNT